jgi:hypothetical protein
VGVLQDNVHQLFGDGEFMHRKPKKRIALPAGS